MLAQLVFLHLSLVISYQYNTLQHNILLHRIVSFSWQTQKKVLTSKFQLQPSNIKKVARHLQLRQCRLKTWQSSSKVARVEVIAILQALILLLIMKKQSLHLSKGPVLKVSKISHFESLLTQQSYLISNLGMLNRYHIMNS